VQGEINRLINIEKIMSSLESLPAGQSIPEYDHPYEKRIDDYKTLRAMDRIWRFKYYTPQ
jgi:hypothetical protein